MDIGEIDREIERLESRPTSYTQLEKLAILHAIRDRYAEPTLPNIPVSSYSFASAPASEFIDAATGVPIDRLLEIMDSHMECIQAIYPKEYDAVVRKLNSAKE